MQLAPIAARSRHELNDLGAHGKISEIKMRSNPPIASAIRQAVAAMRLFLFWKDYWRWGRTAARFDGTSRYASKS